MNANILTQQKRAIAAKQKTKQKDELKVIVFDDNARRYVNPRPHALSDLHAFSSTGSF
jgi:hypothetical protein